jgi:hypothetical protein
VDGGSSNSNGLFRAVNASAIQEVQVIVGGMEAEYGNAQGGIVNVITRDGTQQYGGSSEYKMTLPGKKHWGYEFYDPEHRFLTIDPATLKVTYDLRNPDPTWAGELYVKPGTDRQFGTADDQKYLAHEMPNYTDVVGHRGEVMFNGPITSNASFIATAATIQEAAAYPTPDQTGYYTTESAETGAPNWTGYIASPYNLRSSGKLSFRPSDNISVKLGAVMWHNTNFQPTPITGGTTMLNRNGEGNGAESFFLLGKTSRGKRKDKDDIFYLSLQHSLSPRTLYEARFSAFITKVDTADVPMRTTANILDRANIYTVDKDDFRYDIAQRNRLQFRFDLSSQVTKGHFIKTGVELTRYDSWNFSYNLTSTSFGAYTAEDIALGSTLGGGAITNVSAFPTGQTYKYNNGIPSGGLSLSGLTGNGLPIGRGGDSFEPMQFAAYLQDRMEFQGMVLNAGVRFDALWIRESRPAMPGAWVTPMYDQRAEFMAVRPGYDHIADIVNHQARYMPMAIPPSLYQVSPRIGVSHPITDRSLVRFAFGQFFQVPSFSRVFSWSVGVGSASSDFDGDGIIQDDEFLGTGLYAPPTYAGDFHFAKAEQTFNMEVGIDWNFVSDYTMSVATFYKSASDQQVRYPPSNSIYDPVARTSKAYGSSPPDGFEDSRGIELAFRKSFSNYFSFQGSYNATWRTGGATTRSTVTVVPDSAYIVAGNWWTTWSMQNGTYQPVIPDAATLATWGHNAQEEVRRRERDVNQRFDGEVLPGLRNYRGVSGTASGGPGGADIVESTYPGTSNGDRRHNVALTVTAGTPPSFGPAVRGFSLLGGIRSNIVYRFYSGIPYSFVDPATNQTATRWSMIQTYADLSITKTIGPPDGIRADVFFEATNLFNQENVQTMYSSANPPGQQWESWGWPYAATNPDNSFIRVFGEMDERGLYAGQPRIMSMGLRFFW